MDVVVPSVVLVDQPSGLTFIPQIHVVYDDEQVPEVLRTHAVLEIEIDVDGKIRNLKPGMEEVQIVSTQAIPSSDNIVNLVVQGCFPARHALPDLVDHRLPFAFEEQYSHFLEREKVTHSLLNELAGDLMKHIYPSQNEDECTNILQHDAPLQNTIEHVGLLTETSPIHPQTATAPSPSPPSVTLAMETPTHKHTTHQSAHPTSTKETESLPTQANHTGPQTKSPSSPDPVQSAQPETHHRHGASYISPSAVHTQQPQIPERPRALYLAQPSPRRPAFTHDPLSPQTTESDIRNIQTPMSQTQGRTAPRSFPYKVDAGVSPQSHAKKLPMDSVSSPFAVPVMSASPPLQLQLDSIVNTTVDSFRFQMENLANMYLRPPPFTPSPQPTGNSPSRDVKAQTSTRSPPFMVHESPSPSLADPTQRSTM